MTTESKFYNIILVIFIIWSLLAVNLDPRSTTFEKCAYSVLMFIFLNGNKTFEKLCDIEENQ